MGKVEQEHHKATSRRTTSQRRQKTAQIYELDDDVSECSDSGAEFTPRFARQSISPRPTGSSIYRAETTTPWQTEQIIHHQSEMRQQLESLRQLHPSIEVGESVLSPLCGDAHMTAAANLLRLGSEQNWNEEALEGQLDDMARELTCLKAIESAKA